MIYNKEQFVGKGSVGERQGAFGGGSRFPSPLVLPLVSMIFDGLLHGSVVKCMTSYLAALVQSLT